MSRLYQGRVTYTEHVEYTETFCVTIDSSVVFTWYQVWHRGMWFGLLQRLKLVSLSRVLHGRYGNNSSSFTSMLPITRMSCTDRKKVSLLLHGIGRDGIELYSSFSLSAANSHDGEEGTPTGPTFAEVIIRAFDDHFNLDLMYTSNGFCFSLVIKPLVRQWINTPQLFAL